MSHPKRLFTALVPPRELFELEQALFGRNEEIKVVVTEFPTAALNDLAYLLLFPEGSPHRQGYGLKRVIDGFCNFRTSLIVQRLSRPVLTDEVLWVTFELACDTTHVMADVLSNVVDEQTAGLLIPAAKAFLKEYHKA